MKSRQIYKKLQIKSFQLILSVLLLIFLVGLNGCGAPKYHQVTDSLRQEMLEHLKRGDLVLDCQFECLWSQLNASKKQHDLYLRNDWEGLAVSVMQVGMEMDLCYFYLGAAAEGVGYTDAANKYYRQSYNLLRYGKHVNRCENDVACNSMQLALELPNRLQRLTTEKGGGQKQQSIAARDTWEKCRDEVTEGIDYYEVGEEEFLKTIQKKCGENPPLYISSQEEAIGISPHDLVRTSLFRSRFIQLLGGDFDDFLLRLEVSGATSLVHGWIVGEGNAPHRGGADWAAFAINTKDGKIYAVMASSGRGYKVTDGYLNKYGFMSWKHAPAFLRKRCEGIVDMK